MISKFLFVIIFASMTSMGISYAQEGDSNCKNMKEYSDPFEPPHGVFRQGYQAKCFTVSGNVTYVKYVPNATQIQQIQNIHDLSSVSTLHVLSDSSSEIDALLNTGQTKDIPITIHLDNGSNLSYARFSLDNLPQNVQAWMNPNVSDFFVEKLNKHQIANATISIFVDSGTKSGKYDILIIATDGTVTNSLGNETQLHDTVVGMVHLTVSGSDSIWATVGLPVDQRAELCSGTDQGGRMCSGFVAYEQYPVTVYSSSEKQVKLSMPDLPAGKYARFMPDTVIAGPNGIMSTLTVAGIVKPGVPNGLYNPTVMVTAKSIDGINAVNYLQIAKTQNLTVISSPTPIDLTNIFGGNGRSGYTSFGVVYDPVNYSSASLPVKLSVLGLDDGGKITPLPSGLSVLIPDSSFLLQPATPYYFPIEFTSKNVTFGTYPVAIDENVGGSHFVQDTKIKIYEPARFGGPAMNGPAVYPVSPSTNQDEIDTGWLIETVTVGLIAGGVGVFLVLYFTRKQ